MAKDVIEIKSPRIGMMILLIKGDTDLLSNRKDESIAQGIEDIKSGKKTGNKPRPLTPEEQFKRSLHSVPKLDPKEEQKYGFPASGFMKAGIAAASGKDWWEGNVDGKRFKGSVRVLGDIIPIEGKLVMSVVDGRRPPRTGAPCKIYRGQFKDWSCKLPIRFNANLMSPSEIVAIFNMAGFSIGIGDDRPGKNGGQWGQFHVEKVEGGDKYE